MSSLPLEGIRIVDLSMWWSGPLCTSYFGAQGAEVIKVESIQQPDGFRYTMSTPGENWWELGPQFNATNHNKLGITLNLDDTKGIELFKELVVKSDVVIENFTPRVMGNFGLSYEILRKINPQIIMLSMPAYGKTGPFRNEPGFAYTFEILSGIAQVNGYLDENPRVVLGSADVISAFHAAYVLLAALEYREKTGIGQYIEIAQIEACLNLMGQPIADVSMNGRSWGRMGNRHPDMAPHGVYRSKGDDDWVAIAITNDEEWLKFCEIMGNIDLADDKRFRTLEDRLQNQEELDKLIENWTSQLGHYEAAELLQKAGLGVGPVLEMDEVERDPFLRGMFQEITRDLVGKHLYPAWPVKFSGKRVQHRIPTPKLGQHNEYVLKDLLGLSPEEISFLEQKEIIGQVPFGAEDFKKWRV